MHTLQFSAVVTGQLLLGRESADVHVVARSSAKASGHAQPNPLLEAGQPHTHAGQLQALM